MPLTSKLVGHFLFPDAVLSFQTILNKITPNTNKSQKKYLTNESRIKPVFTDLSTGNQNIKTSINIA